MSTFSPVDPHRSTREQFTGNLVYWPIPSNASDEFRKTAVILMTLLSKLAAHDAMAPNMQQTYMTPANSKNKVYFMWDFVGRTLGYLANVPSDKKPAELDGSSKEIWTDALSRNEMAKNLLLDSQPGMVNMMTESTYPDQGGQHPSFEEDILELARRL